MALKEELKTLLKNINEDYKKLSNYLVEEHTLTGKKEGDNHDLYLTNKVLVNQNNIYSIQINNLKPIIYDDSNAIRTDTDPLGKGVTYLNIQDDYLGMLDWLDKRDKKPDKFKLYPTVKITVKYKKKYDRIFYILKRLEEG